VDSGFLTAVQQARKHQDPNISRLLSRESPETIPQKQGGHTQAVWNPGEERRIAEGSGNRSAWQYTGQVAVSPSDASPATHRDFHCPGFPRPASSHIRSH
jgi:hypothetical protein